MDTPKTPEERAAALALRQKECSDRLKREGKHCLTGKTLPSNPTAHGHIGEWIKPTLKAIKRRQQKQAKQHSVVTPIKRKA